MRCGVIFYHKNIFKIYDRRWVEKCVSSIIDQTIQDFTIYEVNYGDDGISLFSGIHNLRQEIFFTNCEMNNHAEAMNFIIDLAFQNGEDFIFNTNLDDYYSLYRMEKQIEALEMGFDVVSSDFCYMREVEGKDEVFVHKNILQFGSISENINKNHNIIAHPAVAFSKRFWSDNRYSPSEIPEEDLFLWKRAIDKGYKFYIHPEELLFYRIHQNQITGG